MAGKTSTDPNVFILPDLGEGVHEAELIAWKVKVGDSVEEHDILAEMETDKALVEVPSPRKGVIKTLHGEAGEILHVGNPLVTYEGGSNASESPAASHVEDKPAKAQGTKAGMNNNGAADEDAGTVVGAMSAETPGMSAREGKALATPAVRRLARDLGVEIDLVPGSGIGGRVTAKDIESFAAGGGSPRQAASRAPAAPRTTPSVTSSAHVAAATAAPAPTVQRVAFEPGAEATRVPFRGVRRKIAERLRSSVDTAVHFTVMDEADVSELDLLRKQLAAASGEKVSFLPFVCSAVARALTSQFGALNATVDDEASEIVQHRSVHLGIATDTESGLMVPVIRDSDRMGVLEISRQIASIAASARDRSIGRESLSGSTFTISNVGSHAGRFATPVINAPEVGILAVGRTREGMVVKNGWFRVGKLMPLSLACDHRVVDGATAALCLAEIVRLIEAPNQLLTPARG